MKIGLVVEGGGMKCAYSAAILDAFLDHNLAFAYCIGVSGGAGNLTSYLAKQWGRNLRFYTEHTHSPDYFGLGSFLKTGDLFGLHYIYGTLANSTGKDPLDFPALQNNPAEYEVVVTNAFTGQAEYFGKETMQQDDYRLIMASCAIPAACRPVELNGVPYYDGGISDAIPVSRALEKGCSRLVVILSKTRDFVRKPQGMRFFYARRCRQYPQVIARIDQRHINYNRNLQEVFALEKEGKAFVFAPSRPIHVGTYSVKEPAERELYALGMEDFGKQQNALAAFLAE